MFNALLLLVPIGLACLLLANRAWLLRGILVILALGAAVIAISVLSLPGIVLRSPSGVVTRLLLALDSSPIIAGLLSLAPAE